MELIININLDNDAFQGLNFGIETSRLLKMVADKLAPLMMSDAVRECNKGNRLIIKDDNGNKVGKATFTI